MYSRSKHGRLLLVWVAHGFSFSYADFMLVSKEINVLENEMLEFKDSLAEWKSMPSLLHIEESSSAAGDHS